MPNKVLLNDIAGVPNGTWQVRLNFTRTTILCIAIRLVKKYGRGQLPFVQTPLAVEFVTYLGKGAVVLFN